MQSDYKKDLDLVPATATKSPKYASSGLITRGASAVSKQQKAESSRNDYWLNLGNELVHQERFEEAKLAFLRGLELEPNDVIIMHAIGSMYFLKFALREFRSVEQALKLGTEDSQRSIGRDFEALEQAVHWWSQAKQCGYAVDEFRLLDLKNMLKARSQVVVT